LDFEVPRVGGGEIADEMELVAAGFESEVGGFGGGG